MQRAGEECLDESHPGREIGVRIETHWWQLTALIDWVTPVVRSGCGLKLLDPPRAARRKKRHPGREIGVRIETCD